MRYRHKCIAVVAVGMASLILGAWLVGEIAPNLILLLLGAFTMALVTTQLMFVAILMIASRHERSRAEDRMR